MNNTDCHDAVSDLKDDKVPGLQLRVRANSKAFYLYYRREGQQRRPKIGDFPGLTVAEAREIARAMLRDVSAGLDPSAARREARKIPTVRELGALYMERHGDLKKSAKEDRRQLEAYVYPALGKLKVTDVRVTDVDGLHKKLKDRPVQANRVLALVSKMMSLAETWEYRPLGTNPCSRVTRFRERKRIRYGTAEELGALMVRLRHYLPKYRQQATFLLLGLYTGARPIELRTARREDYSNGTLTLRDHKTDGHVDLRTIHLPAQAVELIEQLPKTRDGSLLGIKSPRHLWDKLMEDTGIEGLRRYDLRHSFASVGLSFAGLTLDEIGGLFDHRSTATTSRYAHLIDTAARAAAAKTADAIDVFAKAPLRAV